MYFLSQGGELTENWLGRWLEGGERSGCKMLEGKGVSCWRVSGGGLAGGLARRVSFCWPCSWKGLLEAWAWNWGG